MGCKMGISLYSTPRRFVNISVVVGWMVHQIRYGHILLLPGRSHHDLFFESLSGDIQSTMRHTRLNMWKHTHIDGYLNWLNLGRQTWDLMLHFLSPIPLP